jgi:hypothetical protein
MVVSQQNPLNVNNYRSPVNPNALTALCVVGVAESCLVSDELLQYRHFMSKQQYEKDLTDEQEEEVLGQFAAMDPEKKGHIEWSDFLYFESMSVLRKLRTEVFCV